MSAPPLLRPLRSILQRRLHTVSSRPVRTPHVVRASHYRHQFRYNSSTSPDQPPKPENAAQEASNEQAAEGESTPSATLAGSTQNNVAEAPETPADAERPVTTNFQISGPGDTLLKTDIPRLDSLLVKSAFQQLRSTNVEIQAGIEEAVARQLKTGDSEPVLEAAELHKAGSQQASSQTAAHAEVAPEDAVLKQAAPEEVVQEAAPDIVPQEPFQQELPQQATSPKAPSSDASPAQPVAPLGLEALMTASPDQIAAMMAYLQTLQAGKSPAASVESTESEPAAPKELQQQLATEPAAVESHIFSPSSADTVTPTSQFVDPAEQQSETLQAAETRASECAPAEDGQPEPMNAEDEPVVKSIFSQEQQAIQSKELAPEYEPKSETRPETVSVTKSLDSPTEDSVLKIAVDTADQPDNLDSAMEEQREVNNLQDKASSVDDNLKAMLEEALEKSDRDAHAAELSKRTPEGPKVPDLPEPSRLPRNVASYYLQPLRRVAEYGVPACDLQLRSYSVRPLESFCDFALRAAYYLGLPAYGPVPLPKIIQRWTVPKSHFIFKKSQENFERITRRRLIQIKDGNPETVQIWLAFLQKHQQAAVGMKANLWEFSSIDVAKQMDEAYKEAEPIINDKFRLLVQNKEFESVEKVDELLQAERYRLTGDRVERNQ